MLPYLSFAWTQMLASPPAVRPRPLCISLAVQWLGERSPGTTTRLKGLPASASPSDELFTVSSYCPARSAEYLQGKGTLRRQQAQGLCGWYSGIAAVLERLHPNCSLLGVLFAACMFCPACLAYTQTADWQGVATPVSDVSGSALLLPASRLLPQPPAPGMIFCLLY